MKVAVVGLWHLGTVTAACLASAEHRVLAYDQDREIVAGLQAGRLPVAEPGLAELTKQVVTTKQLTFSCEPDVVQEAEIVWITYDTPVDQDDHADVDFVVNSVVALFPFLRAGTLVLISSQLPVGSTARIEELYRAAHPDSTISFAYLPENLRLGKAIEVLTHADRFVVGVHSPADRDRIAALLAAWNRPIEWVTVESAEMTKHAINAFLATSVVFINELAAFCEKVGADVREVERGLKSDCRIGPRAYLSAGAAFSGGTLARDIGLLLELGKMHGLAPRLFPSVQASNQAHAGWPGRRLREVLGPLVGRRIGVLGLTYKPGTDTLRRSIALETCRWLRQQGATVQAYDPAIKELPGSLGAEIRLCPSIEAAAHRADALAVLTPWPNFRALSADLLMTHMAAPVVVDASGYLAEQLGRDPRIRYITVGSPTDCLFRRSA